MAAAPAVRGTYRQQEARHSTEKKLSHCQKLFVQQRWKKHSGLLLEHSRGETLQETKKRESTSINDFKHFQLCFVFQTPLDTLFLFSFFTDALKRKLL